MRRAVPSSLVAAIRELTVGLEPTTARIRASGQAGVVGDVVAAQKLEVPQGCTIHEVGRGRVSVDP
jgi:hypothetical protein